MNCLKSEIIDITESVWIEGEALGKIRKVVAYKQVKQTPKTERTFSTTEIQAVIGFFKLNHSRDPAVTVNGLTIN